MELSLLQRNQESLGVEELAFQSKPIKRTLNRKHWPNYTTREKERAGEEGETGRE